MKPKILDYPSGAKLIYEQRKSCDFTHIEILFRVGSNFETKSNQGVAHFLEHMAFASTEKHTRQERLDFLNQKAARINASTSVVRTKFFLTSLNKFFLESLEVFCEGLNCPKFDAQEVENEKGVIINERNGRLSRIERVTSWLGFSSFYKDFAHSHDAIGTEESIRSMTPKKLRDFMKFYTPDKLIISGAGGLSFKKFKSAVEKILGKFIFSQEVSKKAVDPKIVKSPVFLCQEMESKSIFVKVTSRIFDCHDKLFFPLKFLITGLNKELFDQVRNQNSLVYAISVLPNFFRDYGTLELNFQTDNKNIAKVFKIYHGILKDIAENGLTPELFQMTKNKNDLSEEQSNESTVNVARQNLTDLMITGEIKSLKEIKRELDKVTNDDLKEVAKTLLASKSCAVVGVGTGIDEETLKSYLDK